MLLAPVHVLGALELVGFVDRVRPLTAVLLQSTLWVLLWRSVPATWHLEARGTTQARSGPVPGYLKLSTALVGGCWAAFTLNWLTSYPAGWDANVYHFPVALRFLRLGSLGIPAEASWRGGLPGNDEILEMLGLALGFEPFASASNLVAGAISLVAVYSLSKWVSGSAEGAALSALVFGTLPIVQFQAFSGYVDLFGASLLLAGGAILVSGEDRGVDRGSCWPTASTYLAGLACGVAVGTKPTLWPYGALFVAVGSLYLFSGSRRGSGAHHVFALVVATSVPSVFWFARAFLQTGNPFYPFGFALGPFIDLPGFSPRDITAMDYELHFVRSRLEWLVYPWVEFKRNGHPFGTGSGLGSAFATFVPLGLGYGLLRWRGRSMRSPLGVVLLLLVTGALLWSLGLRRVPRFGLPVLALACVASSVLLQQLSSLGSKGFRLLFTFAVAIACATSAFVPLHQLLGRYRSNAWSRSSFYHYPEVIEGLPGGSRIVNLAGPRWNFPLAGARLSLDVVPCEWTPSVLSRAWARQEGIDYVVERAPFSFDEAVSLDAVLVFSGDEPANADGAVANWRVWSLGARGPLPDQSARTASSGSILVARLAGSQQPSAVAATRTRLTAPSVTGSVGSTSNKCRDNDD